MNGKLRPGWARIKLKEVCEKVTVGHVGPMVDEYVDEGIPFLRSQNIKPFSLDLSGIKYISPAFHQKLKKSALYPGDVAVIRTGYPGTACVIPKKLPESNCADLVIFRLSRQLDPYYLTCLFNSTWGKGTVAGSLVGVAQQHFNVTVAKEMEVPLPPLETQHKIASILYAYDELIENNARRIKILEEMAQTLYREWFVNFRFPGHEQVKMVDSSLGMVPEGWEVKTINDVAVIHRGRSYKSEDLVENGGLPFLNLKCIERDGGFRYDGIKRYQGQFKDFQVATVGEIIMAVTDMTQERRLIARAARVPSIGEDKAVISMDLVKISPKPLVDSEYLYGVFRFSSFPDEIKQYANGANVLHLKPDHISSFTLPLPPKVLQSRYGEIAKSIYLQCDNLNKKNQNLRKIHDLLLPKLIAGEVDVSELEISVGAA